MLYASKNITGLAVAAGLLVVLCALAQSNQYTKFDRDRAQGMLREVAADVQKYYYDPKFHGLDWDARVRQAQGNIDKADSLDGAVSEIAALSDALDDSHTPGFSHLLETLARTMVSSCG